MTGRILALLAALTGLAGCAPTSGIVTGTSGAASPQVGSVAPDVEYRSVAGGQASFNKVRRPVTIIAFVAPPGGACCWLEPGLVNLADQFWDLPVTVAQFSLPTSQCPHGSGCSQICNIHQGSVMSFCDPQHLAWDAYGRPTPGELILIGPDDRIVMKGLLDAPQAVIAEAQRLGEMEKDRLRGPGGEHIDVY